MIKRVAIRNVACFDSKNEATLEPTLINYIYGSNGSGKTTISNIIADSSKYSDCSVVWTCGDIKTLVYNKNFIEDNYEQPDSIRGIFTLGKGSKDIQERILKMKGEIGDYHNAIIGRKNVLEKKADELSASERTFAEKCWAVQKKYDVVFVKAFERYRGAKLNFMKKVLAEYESNSDELHELFELEENANEILNEDATIIPEVMALPNHDYEACEKDPIFQTRIIGKNDVDIATMIQRLDNSDWVKQGREYYENNDMYCPFCQQSTTDVFQRQLEEYFDETYLQKTRDLDVAIDNYIALIDVLLATIKEYIEREDRFVSLDEIKRIKTEIEAIKKNNLLLLEKKKKEPTLEIELESVLGHVGGLDAIVDVAIEKTKNYNVLVGNIKAERSALIEKIWAFVLEELRSDYRTYHKSVLEHAKAKKAITDQNNEAHNKIASLNEQIEVAERSIASVQPTIVEINKMLTGFGFTSFVLAEGGLSGTYKIVRQSGEDARPTLSEGEKTFIMFLYFFYLTRGSYTASEVASDKVIVVDDPISSLDSSVLFVVSSLVRKLISECNAGKNGIRQIFILTHNVYFHKEVTYNRKRDSEAACSFWIVRRTANSSEIVRYQENPIRTSYDLLWQEIRNTDLINKMTVCNTLRRILEYYFKILGRSTDDDILEKFDDDERIICSTLLSWINDGSHVVNDDMFVATDDEAINKYMSVFKKIFEVEDQIAHYNMMMKAQ